MKKTSYVIIGLLLAGAVGAFVSGFTLNRYGSKCVPLEMSELTDTTSVGRFGVLAVEMRLYSDSVIICPQNHLEVKVNEDSTIESPRLTMSVDWHKYVTLRESGDSLILDVDFHDLIPGKKFESDRGQIRGGVPLTVVPSPITVDVPAGMLKGISPFYQTDFMLSGLTSDSLELAMGIPVKFVGCRIDKIGLTVDVSGDFSYGRGVNCVDWTLDSTNIGLLTVEAPAVNLNLTTEDSHVGRLNWTDTSGKGDKTAWLGADAGAVGHIDWISPAGNKLEYEMTMTGSGHINISE